MAEDTLRDTVPAPPVPSTNPIADLRQALEESSVVLRREDFAGDTTWYGVRRAEDGVYDDVTPRLTEAAAAEWLRLARYSVVHGTVFPRFCKNGHLCSLPEICETCLRERR